MILLVQFGSPCCSGFLVRLVFGFLWSFWGFALWAIGVRCRLFGSMLVALGAVLDLRRYEHGTSASIRRVDE